MKPRTSSATRALDVAIAVGLALFVLALPFHLVIKRLVPGPIGTYWKEGLMVVLMLWWAARWVVARASGDARSNRQLLLSNTPLDGAVLAYLALLLLRMALDRSGWIGAWGLYISVLYLPLFWLVATTVHSRPPWAIWLTVLLASVGGIVALGGLAEFLLDVSLWPSDEIIQRLGHPDFYIYGTHVRRVYFTFDSPTTLANTLALLLPLALALATTHAPFTTARAGRGWKWVRIAMALSAALMVGCIVVTFSRGIWVATAVSLLMMGLLSGPTRSFVRRRPKVLLAVGGVLALLAVLLGLFNNGTTTGESATDRSVELATAAYVASPLDETIQKLLNVEPIHGERNLQLWTLPDPIAGEGDTRPVLYEHPPESGKQEIIYHVQVPAADGVLHPALRFSIAVAPQVWSPTHGDGTSFQIHIADADTAENGEMVFVRYVNPKHNPSDRRWRNYLLDLSPWAGRTVALSLITEGGPAGDWEYDWGGWADLEVGRIEQSVLATRALGGQKTSSAIARHASSIVDWVRDETNRDRLAAWSLAFDAWRSAPLWGKGLGTTGTAALRTHPERAFVTESQVLKSLVELGLPGLLAWIYLWFQIARVGYSAYRGSSGNIWQALLIGVLAGLLAVFIEGLVYQNLEVKQVNAYFWTLTGLLAFLARRQTAHA